jgi:hypothetical protein
MSKIELLLRSQLVKDALSRILLEAGFLVLHESDPDNCDAIVVIDFDDFKDPETLRAYQLRGVKIVALAFEACSLEISPDETRLRGASVRR